MAIEIELIAKPTIWLVGNQIRSSGFLSGFSDRVDHSRHLNSVETLTIGGVTQFDQSDLLIFDRNVRIIITDNVGNRGNYIRESGIFDSLVFEGNKTYSSNIDQVNNFSETWFTYNGKDPVRTKAHLYNFRDLNDANYDITPEVEGDNPSSREGDNPSSRIGGSLATIGDINNISSLGFVLSSTANSFITLKARTYFQGKKSRVAIAYFKIARSQDSMAFENRENGNR